MPVKPGSIRVTTKAPEPDKWNAADATPTAPSACSSASRWPAPIRRPSRSSFQKSPTLHPDPKALEKFAKEDLPKSIRAASASREVLSDGAEKIETLTSETATLKGYPSVVNESKFLKGRPRPMCRPRSSSPVR